MMLRHLRRQYNSVYTYRIHACYFSSESASSQGPSELESRVSLLSSKYKNCFPTELVDGVRKIGREAEYPVVWRDGSAADVRLLLSEMANCEESIGYYRVRHEGGFDRLLCSSDSTQLVGLVGSKAPQEEVTLEVGWGTIECSVGPFSNLHKLKAAHENAMSRVVAAADSLGMLVLGYGCQPRTKPSLELMSPRNRYSVMHKAVGNPWLWFTVTASDQTHIDVTIDEVVDAMNITNSLSAVVVALCGNSPIHSGRPSGSACSREECMGTVGGIHSGRHGQPKKIFTSYHPSIASAEWLLMDRNPFKSHLQSLSSISPDVTSSEISDAEWQGFLAHDHYVWHSSRPRVRTGTLELRSACQQPWEEHMSAQALNLALVEAWRDLDSYIVDELFDGDREQAFAYMKHNDNIYLGTNAKVEGFKNILDKYKIPTTDYMGVVVAAYGNDKNEVINVLSEIFHPYKKLGDKFHMKNGKSLQLDVFLRTILDKCKKALENRGFGEEMFLEPLYNRITTGENPAQKVLKLSEFGGLKALLKHAHIQL